MPVGGILGYPMSTGYYYRLGHSTQIGNSAASYVLMIKDRWRNGSFPNNLSSDALRSQPIRLVIRRMNPKTGIVQFRSVNINHHDRTFHLAWNPPFVTGVNSLYNIKIPTEAGIAQIFGGMCDHCTGLDDCGCDCCKLPPPPPDCEGCCECTCDCGECDIPCDGTSGPDGCSCHDDDGCDSCCSCNPTSSTKRMGTKAFDIFIIYDSLRQKLTERRLWKNYEEITTLKIMSYLPVFYENMRKTINEDTVLNNYLKRSADILRAIPQNI